MSYPITQQFIPVLPRTPYRHGASAYEGVVAHSTDNPEATASGNRNFEASGAWKSAFVHFFVDWTSIIQVADTDYVAWGCGPVGNQRYVQIELCETQDSAKFQASYSRYVWLVAKVLYDKKLGVSDGNTLVSHDWVRQHLGGTTHTDPISYLASHGVTWQQLVNDVSAQYFSLSNPVPAAAAIPKVETRKLVLPATDPTWTVYKLGHPCVKANPDNIAGILKPAKFGGLTYEILKDNGNGVYEIQTANFGRVQIYGAPSTGAKII